MCEIAIYDGGKVNVCIKETCRYAGRIEGSFKN